MVLHFKQHNQGLDFHEKYFKIISLFKLSEAENGSRMYFNQSIIIKTMALQKRSISLYVVSISVYK